MSSDAEELRTLLDSFGVANPSPLSAADLCMASVDPDPAIWLEVTKLLVLQPAVSLRLRLALKAHCAKQHPTEPERASRKKGDIWEPLRMVTSWIGRLALEDAPESMISKLPGLGQLKQENREVDVAPNDLDSHEKLTFRAFVYRNSFVMDMTIISVIFLLTCVMSIPKTSCLMREFLPIVLNITVAWVPIRVVLHQLVDGERASNIGAWQYFWTQFALACYGVGLSGTKSVTDMCGDAATFWSHGYPMWICAIPIMQVLMGVVTATYCLTVRSLFLHGFLPQLFFAWATFALVLPVTTPEHPPSFVVVVHLAQQIAFVAGVILGRTLIHGTMEHQFEEVQALRLAHLEGRVVQLNAEKQRLEYDRRMAEHMLEQLMSRRSDHDHDHDHDNDNDTHARTSSSSPPQTQADSSTTPGLVHAMDDVMMDKTMEDDVMGDEPRSVYPMPRSKPGAPVDAATGSGVGSPEASAVSPTILRPTTVDDEAVGTVSLALDASQPVQQPSQPSGACVTRPHWQAVKQFAAQTSNKLSILQARANSITSSPSSLNADAVEWSPPLLASVKPSVCRPANTHHPPSTSAVAAEHAPPTSGLAAAPVPASVSVTVPLLPLNPAGASQMVPIPVVATPHVQPPVAASIPTPTCAPTSTIAAEAKAMGPAATRRARKLKASQRAVEEAAKKAAEAVEARLLCQAQVQSNQPGSSCAPFAPIAAPSTHYALPVQCEPLLSYPAMAPLQYPPDYLDEPVVHLDAPYDAQAWGM